MVDTLKVPGELQKSALGVPRYVNANTFAAATAETFTVPAGINYVVFSCTSATTGCYVRIGGTAAAPADTTDGTASFFLNAYEKHGFTVEEGVAISVIPIAAGVVTMACYSA